MPNVWVLPKDVISEIDAEADRLKDGAFPHNGQLHFYSGPCEAVWNLIAGNKEKNYKRAINWAKEHGATIIDDSPIGKFLLSYAGMGTFVYFDKNPYIPASEKEEAGLLPWKHASRLFALSAHGHVTTTVAGADRHGMYYTVELSNVLQPNYLGLSATEFLAALSTPRKKEVQAINLIPFARVVGEWKGKGIEAAHKMIQRGEIRMALHEALEKSKPDTIRAALKLASKEVLRSPAEAYKYYLESQERFLIDCALQMPGTKFSESFMKNKTPDVRQQNREEHLHQFTAQTLQLIETEIALMSPSSRPDFILPAYARQVAPR